MLACCARVENGDQGVSSNRVMSLKVIRECRNKPDTLTAMKGVGSQVTKLGTFGRDMAAGGRKSQKHEARVLEPSPNSDGTEPGKRLPKE